MSEEEGSAHSHGRPAPLARGQHRKKAFPYLLRCWQLLIYRLRSRVTVSQDDDERCLL